VLSELRRLLVSASLIALVVGLWNGTAAAQVRVLQPGQTVVDSEQPGVVRGTVVDENDDPVGGLVVILHRPAVEEGRVYPEPWVAETGGEGRALAKVSSDAEGRFSFEGLSPSRYRVRPRRSGIGAGTANLAVTKDSPVASVTLRVELGGVVSGIVLDADGQPKDRASVFLVGLDLGDGLNRIGDRPPDRVRTGKDGRFVLLGIPRGIAHVQVAVWQWGWAPPTVFDMREDRVVPGVELTVIEEPGVLAFNGSAGVGVGLDFTPAGPVVDKVYPGSPAELGGVHALELIRAVNGRPTRFMSSEEFRARCRGGADTTVTLSLVRPDGTAKEVVLIRSLDPWSESE
jgi:hypothetical protein